MKKLPKKLAMVGTAPTLSTAPTVPAQVKTRMVVFATPALTGRVTIGYHLSMIDAGNQLLQHGFNYAHILRPGDPYLSKVRSKMATDFLRDYPAAEALFFIDDDVTFPAHKVIEFLQRPEPVLAGLYPMKDDDINFPAYLAADIKTGQIIEQNGLVKGFMVPTGFLRIRREVLEIFARDVPKFVDTEAGGITKQYSHIFQMGMEPDGGFIGEDCKWSKMWIDAGGEIWIDPDIEFSHTGSKTWKANFKDHLPRYRQKGIDEAKAREAAPVIATSKVKPAVRSKSRTNGAEHRA